MIPVFGLSVIFSVVLCVHAYRTGQAAWWMLVILLLQPLGGIVYLVAVLLPQMAGGPTARRIGRSARDALDPTREYRQAKTACDEAPSVNNQIRLAKAAAALGRPEEAEALYASAAHGVHADDPVLLLGRAAALADLGRCEEALPLLAAVEPEEARAPAAMLTLARVYEGVGRMKDAEDAFEFAAGRLPGVEGLARFAAFLARTGRTAQAREILGEIDAQVAKTNPPFRKEARAWRDLAARALAAPGGDSWS